MDNIIDIIRINMQILRGNFIYFHRYNIIIKMVVIFTTDSVDFGQYYYIGRHNKPEV